MNTKLFIIVNRLWNRYYYTDKLEGYHDLLSLMDENTGGVSDDLTESGVLHGVRESLANDRTDNVNQSSVDGTLEKITETEIICPVCEGEGMIIEEESYQAPCCYRCDGKGKIKRDHSATE